VAAATPCFVKWGICLVVRRARDIHGPAGTSVDTVAAEPRVEDASATGAPELIGGICPDDNEIRAADRSTGPASGELATTVGLERQDADANSNTALLPRTCGWMASHLRRKRLELMIDLRRRSRGKARCEKA
jgi:hypothetical protein